MNEKRFEWIDTDTISDNQTDEWYCFLFDDIRDDFVDLLNELNDENKTLKKENEQLKKQNKVTSEFFVVRENDKIIALFTSERRARFYCRENLANLHYQKEEWIRKGVAYNE